jgi:hypothetical protein
MHFIGDPSIGSRSLRWISRVKSSFAIRLDVSLRGRLWRAMLVSGLSIYAWEECAY